MTDTALSATIHKFADPDRTADGQRRARVPLDRLRTLWINTGTLCNIACRNCYIESSPTNDALVYISRSEAAAYLDEIAQDGWPVTEIGFTGGEPFMNPDMIGMLTDTLERGFSALVLTNGLQPMMRPGIQDGLLALRKVHGDRLCVRVSLDHYTEEFHDEERGPGTFYKTLEGTDWLAANGFSIAIAGRTCWGETELEARAGYAALLASRSWPVTADDVELVGLVPRDGRACRRARDHRRLLGDSQAVALRNDVCVEPHDRETPGRPEPRGPALYSADGRSSLQYGDYSCRGGNGPWRDVRPGGGQALPSALCPILRVGRWGVLRPG